MDEFVTQVETEAVTEAVTFEMIEVEPETDSGKSPLGLIIFGLFFAIIIAIIVFFRSNKKKKNTEKTKKKIKVNTANTKFEERKKQENDNLDKYATEFLSKYDFYDDGDDKSKPVIFRDLYQEEKAIIDKENEYKVPKKKDNADIYGFFEEDAQTIKKQKVKEDKKAKLQEEINDGLTDDIDDYFNKQESYAVVENEPEQEDWSYRNEEIETAAKALSDEDEDDAYDDWDEVYDDESSYESEEPINKEETHTIEEEKEDKPVEEPIPAWLVQNQSDDDGFV